MVHMSTGVPIARVAIFHISTATRQVQKSLSKLARFEFVSFHFKSTECPLATQKAAQLFVKNICELCCQHKAYHPLVVIPMAISAVCHL